MEQGQPTYEALRGEFAWRIPPRFNIGVACVDRHPAEAVALVVPGDGGRLDEVTFGRVRALSNRLANALAALGVGPGDRVAVVLPQRLETALVHVAAYKLGAIAVPLSTLFGPEALLHRLGDSGAAIVVTDGERLERVEAAARESGAAVVVVDGRAVEPHLGLDRLLASASDVFQPVDTSAETPALIIYTSGTTGPPKGALHAHRVLLGHQPGFQLSHDRFPQQGDRFWTPADWAWIGGLMNGLLSAWYHGRPIVAASRAGFDPSWAIRLIEHAAVRNTFLPPTALRLIRASGARLPKGTLRTAMSGGEALGEETHAWAREALGVCVNEIYGQTEANYVIGNSRELWPIRPGSMGRAYPGHGVTVQEGEIVVRLPDPVAFLGYWNNSGATADKTAGGVLHTGDRARLDAEGYFWFAGRVDDVISSAGYRIGPEEIELCLTGHPAVALAAAIGVPDPTRGEIVKAFIVPRDGVEPSDLLAREIQEHVRTRLAAYEYPRLLEFVDALPLTVTGKIRRSELRRRESSRRIEAGPADTRTAWP